MARTQGTAVAAGMCGILRPRNRGSATRRAMVSKGSFEINLRCDETFVDWKVASFLCHRGDLRAILRQQ